MKRATIGERVVCKALSMSIEELRGRGTDLSLVWRPEARRIDREIRKAMREAWKAGRYHENVVQSGVSGSLDAAASIRDRINKKYGVRLP